MVYGKRGKEIQISQRECNNTLFKEFAVVVIYDIFVCMLFVVFQCVLYIM